MAKRRRAGVMLDDVLAVLRAVAPEHLAEDWDKVGLQVGGGAQRVRRAVLCIDLTEAVMAEAVGVKADLIVAYHPPIFEPLTDLTDRTWKQRVVTEAVRRGIAVYSPHTALDSVSDGVTDWLCDGLGKGAARQPIIPSRSAPGGLAATCKGGATARGGGRYKVVTFVPPDQVEAVCRAKIAQGAGVIGDYTGCSYQVSGVGSFIPGVTAQPAVGRRGRREQVAEVRLEMVCGGEDLDAVVAAIRQTHGYEEPAIDVYPLVEMPVGVGAVGDGKTFGGEDASGGVGRVQAFDRPVSVAALARRIKRHLGGGPLRVTTPEAGAWECPGGSVAPGQGQSSGGGVVGKGGGAVETVAVCPGSGGALFEKCPDADAYLTGEMSHHQVLNLVSRGKTVFLAGHTHTERPYLPVYRERILKAVGQSAGRAREARGGGVDWVISQADRCPWEVR